MAEQQEAIRARFEELKAQGRKVYWPRRDDSVDLDALAYAEVALEIVQQCRRLDIDPEYLYVAALDTTQAGLVLGFKYLESPIQVRGFSPFGGFDGRFEEMARIANQGARRLGLGVELGPDDFDNDDSFVGEAYGTPTPEGLEAIRTVARTEGILIDPVYTGKAMSALFQHIRDGRLPGDRPVLFVHTGGAPALFGYASVLLEE